MKSKYLDETMKNSTPFRLATYNIHRSLGVDGEFAPKRIAKVLETLDADILGLQEVGWYHGKGQRINQFDFLREATGYEMVPGLVRDHENACFGNALLTKYPVKSYACINLTIAGYAPRGAIQAILETKVGELQVIVVHLGLTPWERYQQMKKIADLVRHNQSKRTIVMGDFNQWLQHTEASSQITSLLPKQINELTFPTRLPVVRLDRMFMSANIELLKQGTLKDETTKKASDHFPLYAQVVW